MRCMHCSREIPEDAFFCPYCGLVIDERQETLGKHSIGHLKDPIVREPQNFIVRESKDSLLRKLEEVEAEESSHDETEDLSDVQWEENEETEDLPEVQWDENEETEDLPDVRWEEKERKEYLRKRPKKKSNKYIGLIGMVVLIMALLMIAIWMVFSTMDANERRAKEERLQELEDEKSAKGQEETPGNILGENDKQEDNSDITMAFVGEPQDFGEYYKLSVEDASASSTIVQEGTDNSAIKAADGSERTSWQEGADGDGIGENLHLTLAKTYRVKYMSFQLGNWNSQEYYDKNNRPKELEITVGDVTQSVTFPDGKVEYWIELSKECPASEIDLVIQSVYKGSEWEDTCIAEIGVYGRGDSQSE